MNYQKFSEELYALLRRENLGENTIKEGKSGGEHYKVCCGEELISLLSLRACKTVCPIREAGANGGGQTVIQ